MCVNNCCQGTTSTANYVFKQCHTWPRNGTSVGHLYARQKETGHWQVRAPHSQQAKQKAGSAPKHSRNATIVMITCTVLRYPSSTALTAPRKKLILLIRQLRQLENWLSCTLQLEWAKTANWSLSYRYYATREHVAQVAVDRNWKINPICYGAKIRILGDLILLAGTSLHSPKQKGPKLFLFWIN